MPSLSPSLVLAVAEAALRRPAFANISRVRLQGDVLEVFVWMRNLRIQAEIILFSLLRPCPLQPVNVVSVQGSQAEAVCAGPSCNLWHIRESGRGGGRHSST